MSDSNVENAAKEIIEEHDYMLDWDLNDDDQFKQCSDFIIGATYAFLNIHHPNQYRGNEAVNRIKIVVKRKISEAFRKKIKNQIN